MEFLPNQRRTSVWVGPSAAVGLPERSVLAEVADGLFAELDFTMEERGFHLKCVMNDLMIGPGRKT